MTDKSDLYRGRFEDFVARRDALAKDLRKGGDREGADRIKAIRKPSRAAWALNVASDGDAFRQLVDAVNATVSAHSKGRDIREAMNGLRESVRAFAANAADIAAEQHQNLDSSALVTALFAIIGDPAAFNQLATGTLADIPEGGSLDILATMSAGPVLTVSSAKHDRPTRGGHRETRDTRDTRDTRGESEEQSASQQKTIEELARAEAQLAGLRKATDQAIRALNVAESELSKAEQRLEHAVNAVEVATDIRDRSRDKTSDASARVTTLEENIARLKKTIAKK